MSNIGLIRCTGKDKKLKEDGSLSSANEISDERRYNIRGKIIEQVRRLHGRAEGDDWTKKLHKLIFFL